MTSLVASLRRQPQTQELERYSFSELLSLTETFSFGGNQYTLPVNTTYGTSRQEPIGNDFLGYVNGAFKRNGIVFAAILARCLLLSEIRFKFRSLTDKKLIGTPALAPLEHPDINQTTGELIFRAEQDASLAGNFYATNRFGGVRRLRPDLVDILISGTDQDPQYDPAAQVVGYLYWQDGRRTGTPLMFLPDEIAHWSPVPDPECRFRGMSWLQPTVMEITSDLAATSHKQKFLENGATVNLAIVAPDFVKTLEQLVEFKDKMDLGHKGVANAYKTLYLAAGSDVKTVGADLAQIDFKATQGAGETRIAVASRVPPPVLFISEGMQGSSLNAGNLGVARRLFADGWGRPTWRSLCAALTPMVQVPQGFELWHDTSDVAFLREDETDAAQITATKAQAMRQLTDGGYDPASVVAAVTSGDMTQLKHTGLLSVQMQPPGSDVAAKPAPEAKKREDEMVFNIDARTTIEQGAIGIEVDAAMRDAAIHVGDRHEHEHTIEVQSPEVNVDVRAAEPVVVPAPVVNIEQAPPVVVPAPEVRVSPAPVNILPTPPRTRQVVRDKKGEIVEVREVDG